MTTWFTRVLLAPAAAVAAALFAVASASAAQLQVLLPLGRTAYQTNELIDLSVVRSDSAALTAGTLSLTLAGADASKLAFTFPTHPAALANGQARVTEHLHLNGWLMRPGTYTVTVASDGATANTTITLVSHVRQSTFKNITWGTQAQDIGLAFEGEDSLGFNLLEGDFWKERVHPNGENSLLGGADFMMTCTMGGAHQMEMDSNLDWSDPGVVRAGRARVSVEAQVCRTLPNQYGVHFYDEPGLTWEKHPVTGETVPFNILTQDAAYRKAFGTDPPEYNQVKANDPVSVARWNQMGRWKEEFMEAAWRDARAGVEEVNPDLVSATQSEYGWNAYTDGYYFNVVRSMPVISGHGGYDDGPASYFYPSYAVEFGRMRDLNKPVWYLPSWYSHNQGELFRLEQYLSFQTNLQGMATPPGLQVETAKNLDTPSIVESNKIFSRLGPIFNVMPVTRGDVAILYSISQDLGAQIESGMKDDYEGGGHTRGTCLQVYLAGKMLHIPFFPIVEEDVTDGTLAANHKAVIVAGINYLDPKVVSALEDYVTAGGTVLETDDCKVAIKGATKVGMPASGAANANIEALWATGPTGQEKSTRLRAAKFFMDDARPLAKALGAKLAAIGIKPVAECTDDSIAITRQAQGDIEYLFAVNASGFPDPKLPAGESAVNIIPATATIGFTPDNRPIYDAVRGGVPAELAGGAKSALFRFGPGEMRVFARTARPIGGVHVSPIVQFKDFTVSENPINIKLAATLEDAAHDPICGVAPMEIKVVDPLGVTRYDIFRATDDGVVSATLPLAANDPAGSWRVIATELLDNHTAAATFTYKPAGVCGAVAGASPRAVYFGDDRRKIFEFVRRNPIVTIAVGSSAYDTTAAQRLADSLKPWGVTATIVDASKVGTNPIATADQALDALGFWQGHRAKVGTDNDPIAVGYNITGGAVLIGNPSDNPLIKYEEDNGVFAYTVTPDFPGNGRGYIGWQSDLLGNGKESITLIATDAIGMAEAAGTVYECAAGLEPLTTLDPPLSATVVPASVSTVAAPPAKIIWSAMLPDRATSLASTGSAVKAYTLDGTMNTLDASGRVVSSVTGPPPAAVAASAAVPVAPAGKTEKYKIVKQTIALPGGGAAVAYWGGELQTFDKAWSLKTEQMLPGDIDGMAVVGSTIAVGLSDGRVVGVAVP